MRSIRKLSRKDEYLCYCRICGELTYASEDKKYMHDRKCPNCAKTVPFFGKDSKNADMIISDEKIGDDFPGDEDRNIPSNFWGFTLQMYEYMWEKYVDIPENTLLDRERHEKVKAETISYFNRGGYSSSYKSSPTVHCPKCGSTSITAQKQGFGVGKAAAGAVAGAVVAGPIGLAGAAAGAAGANKMFNVCQKCGHKWEVGK